MRGPPAVFTCDEREITVAKKKKKLSTKRNALQEREKADAALRKAAQAARADSLKWLDRLAEDPDSADVLQQKMIDDLLRVYNTPHSVFGRTAGRQRYRELGHYAERLVTVAFGTHTQFRAEAGLGDTRTERRGAARAASLRQEHHVRKYYEQHIEPFQLDPYQKFSRKGVHSVVFASDWHSSRTDPFARRVFLDFVAWASPDIVFFGGDVTEFADFSSHRQFPGHFDMSAADEVEYTRKHIYEPTRKALPNARLITSIGNHEYRLVRYIADRASELSGMYGMNLVDLLGLRDMEIGLVCRSNFLAPTSKMRKNDVAENWMILEDCYAMLHGNFTGPNANAQHFKRFQMSGVNGHSHSPSQSYFQSLKVGPCCWTTAPMMAGPAVGYDYVSTPNQWQSGFVYATVDNRTKEVQQHIITVGESATFAGRTWRINDEEKKARGQAWGVQ